MGSFGQSHALAVGSGLVVGTLGMAWMRRISVMRIVWLLLACLLALSGIGVHGEDVSGASLTPTQVFEKCGPSVVLIVGLAGDKGSTVLGTGFLVTSSGVFVTNYHVIQGIFPAQVKLANGDVFDSLSIIETDERKDIAVLKVKGFNLPSVTLGDSDAVKPGDKVTVIGNPKGLEGSVTDGLVSAVRDIKDIVPEWEGYKFMQISAAISPGSSGSPVFDEHGRVIGIASATLKDGQNLNLAIPINYARGMVSEKEKMSLEEFSKTSKPPLLGTSAAAVKVDDEDWGKRMAPVLRKLMEAIDHSIYGAYETISPHTKEFRSGEFAVSASLYLAREKLRSAAVEVSQFSTETPSLAEVQQSCARFAEKYLLAIDKQMELLKSVPGKGFTDYNAGAGEVAALFATAWEASPDPKSWAAAYLKFCPKQLALLPWSVRHSADVRPSVRLGFRQWMSRDDVVVLELRPKEAAERAGFKPGDAIVGVEKDVRFKTWDDWCAFLSTKKPGDYVKFEIMRNGEKKVLKAKLMPREG